MISNFWIFVTQISSVLVYVGIALGLYRLLAAQKDATIQAKDATIEYLRIHLQEMKNKIPDILVKQLEERLEIARDEIERLQTDKDLSSMELNNLKERHEITSEIVRNLLETINVFLFLSDEENEFYKDFVVNMCGSIEQAVKTILVSENFKDLAIKQGKHLALTDDVGHVLIEAKKNNSLEVGTVSQKVSYVLLEDNTLWIENKSIAELTRRHQDIIKKLNRR